MSNYFTILYVLATTHNTSRFVIFFVSSRFIFLFLSFFLPIRVYKHGVRGTLCDDTSFELTNNNTTNVVRCYAMCWNNNVLMDEGRQIYWVVLFRRTWSALSIYTRWLVVIRHSSIIYHQTIRTYLLGKKTKKTLRRRRGGTMYSAVQNLPSKW